MSAGTSPLSPRPLPEQDALTAVLSAAICGQPGAAPAPAADIGAAMAVLAAARLDLDRIETRLLEIAHEGTGWAAISRILGLTRAALDEYVRRLRSHQNGPETAAGG
jgi:hypothetical protein